MPNLPSSPTASSSTVVSMAGVVLAGGQSVRMGTDKATLIVDGQRMVDRALRALGQAAIAPLLVSGSRSNDDFALGAKVVPDAHGAEGPLGGIVSTWELLTDTTSESPDGLVVLSCDLPLITGAVIEELVAMAATTSHGAVAHDGDRVQPLVAAYRATALNHMVASWHAGERSVRRLFEHFALATVAVPERSRDADEPGDLSGHNVVWPNGHESAACE